MEEGDYLMCEFDIFSPKRAMISDLLFSQSLALCTPPKLENKIQTE